MEIATLVREYIDSLLAPAPVAGLCAVLFVVLFRADIKSLFGRIATIRFPGGELSTSQRDRVSEVATANTEPPAPQEAIAPPPGLNLNQDQQRLLADFINSERARAELWEYRYLNYFLVPHTQRVLDWFTGLGQATTVQFFDSLWLPVIPNPNERQAVLGALRAHHLLDLQGEMLRVTPKARGYVNWRGPLPPLPNPPLQPTSGA